MIMPSLNQPIDLTLLYLYVLALYFPAQQPLSYVERDTLKSKTTFDLLLSISLFHASASRELYS
nr:MAG TPA: calcium uniporter protein [Caudoviricetes sp.]